VANYLDAGVPDGPVDFEDAGGYFATFASTVSPDDHRSIRDRGAAVASVGRDELLQRLAERSDALEPRLRSLDPAHLIAVMGGTVMRLSDYLATRIVEQTVHLDDLARSVDLHSPLISTDAESLTISVGIEVARRRSGNAAIIRALYREGLAEQTLPVL
jgi:hypothetical protein